MIVKSQQDRIELVTRSGSTSDQQTSSSTEETSYAEQETKEAKVPNGKEMRPEVSNDSQMEVMKKNYAESITRKTETQQEESVLQVESHSSKFVESCQQVEKGVKTATTSKIEASAGPVAEQQVWPQNKFHLFSFCTKSLNCLEANQ